MADQTPTTTSRHPLALPPERVEEIFRGLEPYLKAGLSVHKACLASGVPKSTVYDLIAKDEAFSEKIEASKNFLALAISNSMMRKLQKILQKQEAGEDIDNIELDFLKWFAMNSKATKGEFGARADVRLLDAQAEVQKLMRLIDGASEDEESTEE